MRSFQLNIRKINPGTEKMTNEILNIAKSLGRHIEDLFSVLSVCIFFVFRNLPAKKMKWIQLGSVKSQNNICSVILVQNVQKVGKNNTHAHFLLCVCVCD